MEKETANGASKKNIFVLLFGVLLRPKTTFTYLKDNHKRAWWLPAILILLLTVAPLLAASRTAAPVAPVNMEAMMGEKAMMIEGYDPMMMEAPMQPPTSGLNLFQIAGKIVGTPVAWLLWGAALYLASVFLGRSSSFGQMSRLSVWTWLPYGIRGLVQTVYIFGTGETIANAGLSGFVNQTTTTMIAPGPGQLALTSILGKVDLYMFWHLILLSLGLMAFTNLKYRKALLAVLAIWVVFTLLGIVPAIFGGVLGGVTGPTPSGGGLG